MSSAFAANRNAMPAKIRGGEIGPTIMALLGGAPVRGAMAELYDSRIDSWPSHSTLSGIESAMPINAQYSVFSLVFAGAQR